MALTLRVVPHLEDTGQAFDGVAATYDASNAANPVLSAMRSRALRALTALVPPGASLLDLGCGPGTDAEGLARSGYHVTALDWSASMVEETARRVSRAGLDERVTVHRLGIHELSKLPGGPFDAAYSMFGPMNCVPDLDHAASLIGARVRPGGVLVASVIGRVCPWEIALYLARRDVDRVRIRFARGFVAVPLNGQTVWTRYYAPREFEQAFRNAGFVRIALRAQGLVVPPPYLEAFAERHPSIVSVLQTIEDAIGGLPGLRALGDHFLMVLRKT